MACFGELEFKNLYEGDLLTHRIGWLVSSIYPDWITVYGGNPESPVVAFVNFSEGHEALDPEPVWSECRLFERHEVGY